MIFQGKSIGLEIHQNGFAWVLASGSHVAPVIEQYATAPFPEGFLRPSIREQNILDPASLEAVLTESYRELGTDIKRVSLSIPDLAGKVMLLEMDSPIKDKEEGIDQIKWKLKKSFPIELSELHLDYQVLRKNAEENPVLLVAVAAKNILNEYEELLLSQSLEPYKVDFATFNLYRLFAGCLEIQEQLTILVCFRGVLSVLVFQDGVLDFYRSKFIGGSLHDPIKLYREINSSLLVYSDSKGGWKPQRLSFYTAPEDRELFKSVIQEATNSDPVLVDTDHLIGNSKQKIDRSQLPDILSALGAAARSRR